MAPRSRSRRNDPSSDLLPLFEYSNVVNSSLDLKFILSTMLLTVMGKMLVSKGMVLLRREDDTFEVVSAKGVGGSLEGTSIKLQKYGKGLISLRGITRGARKELEFFLERGMLVIAPISTQSGILGLVGLGEKASGKSFSAADKKLMKSLVNLSASAVEKGVMVEQLRVANRNLDRRYQELNTLFELSKEFNLVPDPQKVIRLLTFSLMGQIGANRYAVCLSRSGSMQIVSSRMADGPELYQAVQGLSALRNPVLTDEMRKKPEHRALADRLIGSGIKAVVPMQVQNQTKGLLLLGDRLHGGSYTKADLEFLYSLGNLAIISIENARLFQETLEKQRLEEELKLAREIQQGLLPRELPRIDGYELAAVNISSKEVGGDYYDVVERLPGEYVVAIGDVSGKGTGAALLMANIQAALRTLAPMGYSMPEATARMNDLAFSSTGGDKFITLFWAIINVQKNMVQYVNAGHNLPFLIRSDGTVERLAEGGLILGMMKTMTPYSSGQARLRSGDTLFLFTDGVSEAMNASGEDFTEERLESILQRVRNLPAREIIQSVRQEVETHAGGVPQSDDVTMLVLKVE